MSSYDNKYNSIEVIGTNSKPIRVFVAMSGGVDSSVAAALLKDKGYDVTGIHMICWDGCENNQDKQDAMRVCAQLEIPFLVWDFRREYKESVFQYMVREYKEGRTPNPDVMCNKEIKFGIFLDSALGAGADFIATGHYVRLHHLSSSSLNHECFELCKAKDSSKDQSYFLWTLTQEQLKYCLFPIGDYIKSEVRELAHYFNLSTSDKKDSQGLCFVGNIDFGAFLRNVVNPKSGVVLNTDNKVIGKHDGAQFYTIGQRHGLNIGGSAEPLYVAKTDIDSNTVVVAEGDKNSALYRAELNAQDLHWIAGVAPLFPLKCAARIRYRQPLQQCSVFDDGRVVFDVPQRAVAPGQSIVFYVGDEMLGGGLIS